MGNLMAPVVRGGGEAVEEENGGFGRRWGEVHVAVRGRRGRGLEGLAILWESYVRHGADWRASWNGLPHLDREFSFKASKRARPGAPLCQASMIKPRNITRRKSPSNRLIFSRHVQVSGGLRLDRPQSSKHKDDKATHHGARNEVRKRLAALQCSERNVRGRKDGEGKPLAQTQFVAYFVISRPEVHHSTRSSRTTKHQVPCQVRSFSRRKGFALASTRLASHPEMELDKPPTLPTHLPVCKDKRAAARKPLISSYDLST